MPRSRTLHRSRRPALLLLLLGLVLLAGCQNPWVDSGAPPGAVKSLRASVNKEFEDLSKTFDALDAEGELELCAPVEFAVARFALYQIIEEKRGATLLQLTRFLTRARRALEAARKMPREGKCVDSDGDGITDVEEARRYRTDPHRSDTDGDGLPDREEIRIYRTDPLRPDTDADLLSDGQEARYYRTSPRDPDTDGDGYPDGYEVAKGTDPNDACARPKGGPRRPGPWRKCDPSAAKKKRRLFRPRLGRPARPR